MLIPENDTANQPLPEELDGVENKEQKAEKPAPDRKDKKRWAEFRQRIEITKSYRKKLIRNWVGNIDVRRGKPFSSQNDEDGMPINVDWSFTKEKQAALFSQVPKTRVDHAPESIGAGPWVSAFERKLNDTLVLAGIEAAMDESLPDCINAAGIGVVFVSFEALTEMKTIPAIDMSIFPPEVQAQAMQSGKLFGSDIPMVDTPQVIDSRYTVRRISPADFLWPVDFTGSDFDNAPWLGYSGRLTWAEAASRFQLTEEDKDKVLTDEQTVEDRLSHDADRELLGDDGKVGFDEIFYHDFQYNTDSKSFNVIQHLVFLNGKTDPVIDEPWQGQRLNEVEGKPPTVIGATKKPIRVLTLSYLTDEDIPPSDTAIARAQTIQLNKGYNHINKQRLRNAPMTWFDVNRLDPSLQTALMRGTWQGAIPVQGDGSRIIGSVQLPAMHQENYLFDKMSQQALQSMWGIGPNQTGNGADVETKGESNNIQSSFASRVGRERAKVAAFFVGIAEVLGSLMCLYEDPEGFGKGFDPSISARLAYSILADSTVLVDAAQRLERLNAFVDKYAKSGYVNLEPVLKEIASLVGLDPATVIIPPKPNTPPPPNISLRLTGGDDMMNPLLLAFMIKAGMAPDPQGIDQAMELIQRSVKMQPPAPPQQPGMPGAGVPGGDSPPQAPGSLPSGPLPPGPPGNVGEANPQMAPLPAVGGNEGTPNGGTQ